MTETLSVEQAESQLHQARQLRDELEARVKDGDTTISRDELVEAASECEFALMRVEGAKATARRIEDEDRRRRADKLRGEVVQSVNSSTTEIVKSYQATVKALGRLATSVVNHNRSNAEIGARVEELRPSDISLHTPLPADLLSVTRIGNLPVSNFSPLKVALAALHEAFTRELVMDRDVSEPESIFLRDLDGPNVEEVRLVRETARLAAGENA